jgi:hypothetical protein
VSLPRSFHQSFPPWSEDVAAVKLQLSLQLVDGLFVFLDGLIVELCRLIERSLEVLNLLREPLQQTVTFEGISRP